ncbi:CREB3 regulatory factor-like [Nilaparvata lugens]|uniref:CREB3 regulatory factor-like n=1 Tax=Nilaparvata lugens TaxID=108931 RepID=UPI00193EB09B|nr:CREB3 regulatory factor-like [Nilaparvata lugens]
MFCKPSDKTALVKRCEYERLLAGIQLMKQLYISKFNGELNGDPQEFGRHTEKITKSATKLKVAGQTTDFVNRILDKVKSGVANGGLDEI